MALRFISAQFAREHNELYHYTTLEGLNGIIKSQSLWATHYRWLNDSSEISLLRNPLITEIAACLRPITLKRVRQSFRARRIVGKAGGVDAISRKEATNFVKSLYKVSFEGQETDAFMSPYILSFCSHSQDNEYAQANGLLSQWRAYGRNSGCCIVFDTEQLDNHLSLEYESYYWPHMNIDRVRYNHLPTTLKDVFPELITVCANFYEDILSGRQPHLTNGFGPFVAGATLFKHQGFQEEREIRIVACPANAKLLGQVKKENPSHNIIHPLKMICYRDGQNGRIPYIELFSDLPNKLPIRRVIVGPSRSQHQNMLEAQKICDQNVIITTSSIPYIQ